MQQLGFVIGGTRIGVVEQVVGYAGVVLKCILFGCLGIVFKRGRVGVGLVFGGKRYPHIAQVVFEVVLIFGGGVFQLYDFKVVHEKLLPAGDRVPGSGRL